MSSEGNPGSSASNDAVRDPVPTLESFSRADEEVLDQFDRVYEEAISSQHSEGEREQFHSVLHKIAEQFRNQHLLQAYEQGTVPTFASMERAVEAVIEKLEEDKEDVEALKLSALLSQRVKEIRRWCSKYEQSLIIFHRQKKLVRFNEKMPDQFKRADEDRRRTHDNLLQSIRSLDETLRAADEIEPLPYAIGRWEPGISVPAGYAHENPLVFSAHAASHEHRELIMDWALVANLEQKMQAQLAYSLSHEENN